MSELTVQDKARLNILKGVITRITEKREKKVITKLVNMHKVNTLTPEIAYSAIMCIAELRMAGSDIEREDLQ